MASHRAETLARLERVVDVAEIPHTVRGTGG
jgi:hypothetical protein